MAKRSPQDQHYLDAEADAFFKRNMLGRVDPTSLRPKKQEIADMLVEAGATPRRVLEYGCNYGDLLHHLSRKYGATCVGVEPSLEAVRFGQESYGDSVRLVQGTMADNEVNDDPACAGSFDLVVIDDVLCWVSRETLLQSLANLDQMLADGGLLFLREFYPLRNTRNRNHHVRGTDVFCHKPAGPHARILTATGTYGVVHRRVYLDKADRWIASNEASAFESRWMDSILRKSYAEFYE